MEAEYVRDIEPGEVLIIDNNGTESLFPWPKQKHSFCIFEHVYFARPDSDIFGMNVYQSRKQMGKILAQECQIEATWSCLFLIPATMQPSAIPRLQAYPWKWV